MKVKADLFKELNNVIETEYKNKNVIENINTKFATKGINSRGVIAVWNEYERVENLDDIELMTFTEAIYEVLKTPQLKLEEYFSDNEILNYKTYIKQDEEKYVSDIILAKNVQKLTDSIYQCVFTFRDLYIMKKNNLTLYNKMTQRACNYKEIGTLGYKVKTDFVDRKKIEEIKDLMKKGKYTPDMISFNIRLMEGKIPQMMWHDSVIDGIGNLTIKPNYDLGSPSTTFVDRIDGNHRFTAAVEAFEEYLNETGEELQGLLSCQFVMMEEIEAKEYVARLFKRSSTDEQWLQAMQNDDYNKFVNNICSKIRNLDKNEIAETWDEMKFENAFTNKRILVDAVQKTDIQVNQMSVQAIMSKKIAELIDIELELLSEQTGKTLNELKDTILKPHFFGGLIIICNELTKVDDVVDFLINANEYILNNMSEFKSLKLDNKTISNERVYSYFKNLV